LWAFKAFGKPSASLRQAFARIREVLIGIRFVMVEWDIEVSLICKSQEAVRSIEKNLRLANFPMDTETRYYPMISDGGMIGWEELTLPSLHVHAEFEFAREFMIAFELHCPTASTNAFVQELFFILQMHLLTLK
jgi:hypothetical protein